MADLVPTDQIGDGGDEGSIRLNRVRSQFRRSVGDIAVRYLRETDFAFGDDRVAGLEDMRRQFNAVVDFLQRPSKSELLRKRRRGDV